MANQSHQHGDRSVDSSEDRTSGDDLDLTDDPTFRRRERLVRRVGTGAIAVTLAAAFAGAFGAGPLSHSEALSTDGSLRVYHERFVRADAPAELRIRVASADRGDTSIRLWVDRDFMRDIVVDGVTPMPVRSAVGARRVLMNYA